MKTSKIIKTFAIAFAGYTMSEIHSKLNMIMAKQERVDAALQKIDAATSGIAQDLRELIEKERDNISEDSIAKLEAAAETLDSTGKLYTNSGEQTEPGGEEPGGETPDTPTEPTEPVDTTPEENL